MQEELEDRAGRARTLDFIGRVHFKKAAYGRARESYVLALTILEVTADRRWKSIVLEDLADLDQEQGSYADALADYEAALRAREEIGDWPGQVYVLHLVGRCYMLQGANREALAWFGQGLERAREIGDDPGRALALYHMGIALHRQGAAGEALARYAEALAIKIRLSDRTQQAWILARMGDANASLQKWGAALARYESATAIWQEIRYPRGVATGLDKTGLAYFRLGRHEEAFASLDRSAEILETGQPAFLAPTLALIGRVHAARGDAERALAYGGRAMGLARVHRQRGSALGRWRTAGARSSGISGGAKRPSRRSTRASPRSSGCARGVVAFDEARTGFLEGKQAVYADAIDLLMELGRVEEALELAERARARAFLDLLGGRSHAGIATARAAHTGGDPPRRSRAGTTTLVEYFSSDRAALRLERRAGRADPRLLDAGLAAGAVPPDRKGAGHSRGGPGGTPEAPPHPDRTGRVPPPGGSRSTRHDRSARPALPGVVRGAARRRRDVFRRPAHAGLQPGDRRSPVHREPAPAGGPGGFPRTAPRGQPHDAGAPRRETSALAVTGGRRRSARDRSALPGRAASRR